MNQESFFKATKLNRQNKRASYVYNLIRLNCTGSILILLVLYASFNMMTSCSKDAVESDSNGSVKFSLSLGTHVKSGTIGDSLITGDSITNYFAIVTIVNSGGQKVFSSKKIQIYSVGGKYFSESVSLEEGTYKLTEFILLKDSEAVYATPVSGSEKAQLVSLPLPIVFTVAKDSPTSLQPEILSIRNLTAIELGYSNLDFTDTLSFKIIAYGYANADSFPVEALLQIRGAKKIEPTGSDTANYKYFYLSYELVPAVNNIGVGDATTYSLTVTKAGYNGWNNLYTKEQLLLYTATPLKVMLRKIALPDTSGGFQPDTLNTEFPLPDSLVQDTIK